ncbi:hypothetical protein [Streptomyces sp. NBC_00557]|uniref:hypothetical protein n=1 Tax=Streptomyces sp. NBC_00557 TaxID=2975776 RepID=UPI002E802E36|nr:hypothetical protein [Streptomyces sp. NBC_00557]WUC40165.1 hypothetical protein OG956_39025 [Streptomyces sp. NBC_00557]
MSPPENHRTATGTTTTRRSAMALTRPVSRVGRPPTPRTAPDPAEPAAEAARLEELLGDPRDPGNPYGRSALWAQEHGTVPAPPAGLPGAGEPRPAADRLARALRPLFRRDLALAHAWGIRPLLCAPVPHPAAALLGPGALTAAAGGVLRGAAGIVDGLGRHEPGVRQWQPVLASAFADLLACESLTAVALRSGPPQERGADGPGPSPQQGEGLAAVVGYLVPQLVGELLGDLELVLDECGFHRDTPERRTLARIVRERAFAGVDWTAASTAQARIVRGLREADGPWPGDGTECAALFRITEAAPAVAPGADRVPAVAATLAGATARLAGADEPATAALARVGRRLVVERRAVATACAATAPHHPADPAARALADRQALLVLAGAVLGVREAAAGARLPFLGGAGWALLALGRITERLGLPLPDRTPDPQPGVWAELARRGAHGLDCDLYATRLRW